VVRLKKPGECPESPELIFTCAKYRIVVSRETCIRCKADPLFKQSMFIDYVRNRASRDTPCKYASSPVEMRSVPCCGGKRAVLIMIVHCSLYHKTKCESDCWLCDQYSAKEA